MKYRVLKKTWKRMWYYQLRMDSRFSRDARKVLNHMGSDYISKKVFGSKEWNDKQSKRFDAKYNRDRESLSVANKK